MAHPASAAKCGIPTRGPVRSRAPGEVEATRRGAPPGAASRPVVSREDTRGCLFTDLNVICPIHRYPCGSQAPADVRISEKILVVDDEKDLLELVAFDLSNAGYRVMTATNGEQALERAREKTPDLIVLDILLPDLPGLEVCRILKSEEKTRGIPIVFLTAKGEEIDRVVGLRARRRRLRHETVQPARARAAGQGAAEAGRSRGTASHARRSWPETCGSTGSATKSRDRQEGAVDLTATEFKLLAHLMEYPGRAMTRDQLLDSVWGMDAFVTDRTIDTHVKRLRAKLGKLGERVETVRGVGYRFRE